MTASLEYSFLFSLLAENASSNLNSLRWLLWALLLGTLLWWLVWAILCKPETDTESATVPDSNEPEDAAQAAQADSQVMADAVTTSRDAVIVPSQPGSPGFLPRPNPRPPAGGEHPCPRGVRFGLASRPPSGGKTRSRRHAFNKIQPRCRHFCRSGGS
ncbi:MAG: hypothetical protein R3F31_18615 [Verrucomicrobiales bacterium]